jgi:uncharacterized protein with HEPN domain
VRHLERVEDYLEHILEAINRATGYLQSLPDMASFRENSQVQDAVVRNIEIIGEAVNKINSTAPEFIQQYSEIPWAQMRGMRSVAIHEYFFLDLEIVWTTVREHLPRLKLQIEALLKERQRARDGSVAYQTGDLMSGCCATTGTR